MSKTTDTRGFGVPNTPGPHHFVVRVPQDRVTPVTILENYGCNGDNVGQKPIERIVVSRDAWRTVADPLRSYLNRRLKEKKIKGSRFSVGDNMIERVLGQEIAVLCWGIEDASEEDSVKAFNRWVTYRPEELHWLYQQVVSDAGKPDSLPNGWRLAIRSALIVRDEEGKLPRSPSSRLLKPSTSVGRNDQRSLFAS